jgi:TPR repeat protein
LQAAKDGNPESMGISGALTELHHLKTYFMCSVLAAVGVMLIQGQGCDRNEESGLQWLKDSASTGSPYGEGLLSRQYLARKLYSKACEAAFR